MGQLCSSNPNETPLPLKKIIVVNLMLFCEGVNSSSIFAYILFLVVDFMHTTKEGAGYYAGILGSSFYVGQLLSSYIWGRLSDKYGRRPVLLAGAAGSFVSITVFGFSRSFALCVFARFMNGLLNGNVGVAKTYIAECTDSTNQAKGFAYMGLMWGIGTLMGASVGGILARPAEKYEIFVKGGFFDQYPYLLANLLGASLTILSFALGYFVLTENKHPGEGDQQRLNEVDVEDVPLDSFTNPTIVINTSSEMSEREDDLDSPITHPSSPFEKRPFSLLEAFKSIFTAVNTFLSLPENSRKLRQSEDGKPYSVFRDKYAIITCLLYASIGFIYTIYDEVWPLWAAVDHDTFGGLGFNTTKTGIALGLTGVMNIMIVLFVYPRLANYLGAIKTYAYGGMLFMPFIIMMPFTTVFVPYPYVLWSVLAAVLLWRSLVAQMQFSSIMALVANSVDYHHMGAVNGLGQSMVAFTRALGPFISASTFAWSATNGLPFPLDEHFVFCALALLMIPLIIGALRLPTRLNKPKIEQFELIDEYKASDGGKILRVDSVENFATSALAVQGVMKAKSQGALVIDDRPKNEHVRLEGNFSNDYDEFSEEVPLSDSSSVSLEPN